MNISDVMDELGDALGAIAGLRVYPFWADRIVPPAAVIGWPDEYNYDAAMVRGGDRLTVPVTILVGKVDARSARNDLAAYAHGSGTSTITYVGAGTAAAGDNESLTPERPSDLVDGDLVLVLASIRSNNAGEPVAPDGYTLLKSSPGANLALFGRISETADTDPTVTFTGGSAGDTTIAQCAAFRGTAPVASVVTTSSNVNFVAAAAIVFPALSLPATTSYGVRCGWHKADFTSVTNVSGFTEIGEPSSDLGNGAGMVWDTQTGTAGWFGGAWTVVGGSSAVSEGLSVDLTPGATRSIKAALESGTYTAFDSLRVISVEFEVIAVASVDYLAGTFLVDIIGTGD